MTFLAPFLAETLGGEENREKTEVKVRHVMESPRGRELEMR